jgi:hypothetical protein
VLLIFEDLHWIDPTTREVLDLFFRRVACLPVLLIATFRPETHPDMKELREFVASWKGQQHVTILTLSRLSGSESEALIRQLFASTASLPIDLIAKSQVSHGVPLFMMTATVVEAELIRLPISAISRLSFEPPYHAPLMARLDHCRQQRRLQTERQSVESCHTSSWISPLAAPTRAARDTGRLVDAALIVRVASHRDCFCSNMGCCGCCL